MSTPLLLSVYHILKRTIIQNSEYFTRLLFTSLNLIYSVANVLNILYIKISKIANFSATFSMLVLLYPTSACLTTNTLTSARVTSVLTHFIKIINKFKRGDINVFNKF